MSETATPLTAVVGIGASAGGLEALSQLLSSFTHDSSAFVVIMHLAPAHRSELAAVLGRSTHMDVVRAKNGQQLQRNVIYVIPEYFDILLDEESTLRLVAPHEQRPRRTIDHFFESLASLRNAKAFGIVLSGAGCDGSAGLHAIQKAGGRTLVQSAASALFADMPRNALPYADRQGTPRELGALLMTMLGAEPV
jgi:two-component system CheB/CheR fusion protein